MVTKKISSLVLYISLVSVMALSACGAGGSGTVKVSPSGTQASLTAIELTPANPSIAVGTNQQFAVTGIYSDNSTQDVTAYAQWASSNTSKVSVNGAGFATGMGIGSATVTALVGSISHAATITVTGAVLESMAISPTNPSIAKGTTQQFLATGTFSDNSTQDLTTSVTWNSSSTGVATISNTTGSKGLTTSTAAGTTTITATSGSISKTTTLTVTPASLVSIAITPTNPSIALGTTQQFTATGTYSDNTTQNLTTTVTWSSSSTGVATINNAAGSKGLATSVAAGSSTITATSGTVSKSTTLTINAAPLVSISITPASPSIASGATRQFTATGTYSDSTTQNLTTTVTWSSSNTGVATISNAAGSKGLATGVGAGTTTITAASGGISNTATLTVTGSSTISLTWDAPTQFTDGSLLNPATDLQSYKLYYGTVSQAYTQTISFSNPGTATVTQSVTLPVGTYFFVVTSVSQNGDESLYSNEVSKSL